MSAEKFDKLYFKRKEIREAVQGFLLSGTQIVSAYVPSFDYLEVLYSLPDEVILNMHQFLTRHTKFGFPIYAGEILFEGLVELR